MLLEHSILGALTCLFISFSQRSLLRATLRSSVLSFLSDGDNMTFSEESSAQMTG